MIALEDATWERNKVTENKHAKISKQGSKLREDIADWQWVELPKQ